MTIATLASNLSRLVGRSVLDGTGLDRAFDFRVEWTQEVNIAGPGAEISAEPLAANAPTGPSLFTALQEQLGLRLESCGVQSKCS